MKKSIHKITWTVTAIVVSCIAVCGTVYAQQACDRTIIDSCIPTCNIKSTGYSTGNSFGLAPSPEPSHQLRSNLSFPNNTANSGSTHTCCKTDRCDCHNQTPEFTLPFVQDYSLLKKNASSLDSSNGAQTATQPYYQLTPHKAVPIYILTESFIC